jgi:hypothetical protein
MDFRFRADHSVWFPPPLGFSPMRYLALAAAIALALPPAVSVDARGPGLPAEAMARADSRSTYLVSFVEPAAPQFRGFQAKDGKRPALAPVSIAVTGQPK